MKAIITLLLVFVSYSLTAQENAVDKSTFGLQTGAFGLWLHNEARLTNSIALRTEAGLDGGFFMRNFYEGVGFVLAPVVTVEPRWYYNLGKRAARGKNTSGNSANFFSVQTSYHPDWFVISDHEDLRIIEQLSIIPTWGIKRNVGRHFTYETGIGLGFRQIFKTAYNFEDDQEVALNLHLRLGYRF